MSDERDVQQVLARSVRAAGHRDGAAMANLFADDGVVEINNNAGVPEKVPELNGPPAIGAAIAGLITPIESGCYRPTLRRIGGPWKIVHHEIVLDQPMAFPGMES